MANRTTVPNEPDKTEEESEKTGFFGSIRGLFNRALDEQAADRNRISITLRAANEVEANEVEEREVYQDNGIYSASRELAMLANLMHTGSTHPSLSLKGKAIFESRELTKTNTTSGQNQPQPPRKFLKNSLRTYQLHVATPIQNPTRTRPEPDQNPTRTRPEPRARTRKKNQRTKEPKAASADEIRRKLANRDADTGPESKGASVFQSRELSNPIPQVTQKLAAASISIRKPTQKKRPDNVDKLNLAQSPEAIRAKLEARKVEPAVSGKASFQSKEVNHLQPQEYISRKVEKT